MSGYTPSVITPTPRRQTLARPEHLVWPVVIALAIGLGATWLARDLWRTRASMVEQRLDWTAERVTNEINQALDLRVDALVRMAADWADDPDTAKLAWVDEAKLLLSQLRGFDAINWVDGDGTIRWIYPNAREDLVGTNLRALPERRLALDEARSSGTPALSRTVELLAGGQGFLVCVPVTSPDANVGGWMVGVIRIDTLFDQAFAHYRSLNANAIVSDRDGRVIYTLGPDLAAGRSTESREVVLDTYRVGWTLQIWPSEVSLTAVRQRLPEVVLAAGWLIGIAVACGLWLARQARDKAHFERAARQALEQEIQLRVNAEAALGAEKERYRKLVEGNPAGVFRSSLDGRLLDCNQAFMAMFGFDSLAETLAGPAIALYADVADRQRLIDQVVASGEIRNTEVRFRRANGGTFWGLETMVLQPGDGPETTWVEGVILDITAEREAAVERDRFFHLTPDLLCVIAPDGHFARLNRAWELTLGHPPAELVGTDSLALCHPEERDSLAQAMASLAGGGVVVDLPARMRHHQLGWIWTEWNAVGGEDGTIYAAGRDVHQRRESEAILRDSEERYRQLTEESPGFIASTDLEGNLLSVNPAAASDLGYQSAELVGRHLGELMPPVARGLLEPMMTRLRNDRQQAGIIELLHRDGPTHLWLYRSTLAEVRGRPQVTIYAQNVTEAKRAEAALARSEAAIRALYEVTASSSSSLAERIGGTLDVGRRRFAQPIGALVTLGQAGTTTPSVIRGGDRTLLLPALHTLAVDVAQRGQPFVVSGDLPLDGSGALFRSCLAAPVRVSGDIHSVLLFVDPDQERQLFAAADREFLALMTSWLSAELERQQRGRELALIGELGDLLQSANSIEEARTVLGRQARLLFPNVSGAVFLCSASCEELAALSSWGPQSTELAAQVFRNEDCWGLRRGREHLATVDGLRCPHRPVNTPGTTLCLPMLALGEILGIVYLELNERGEELLGLVHTFADQLALAIANVQLRESLRNQAIRDQLTGLYNRRYLEESLERELQRAARRSQSVGVIFLDLDHFKQINDTYGHDAGDAVLQAFGHLVTTNVRGEDICCRYGGEEFAIILPEARSEETNDRAELLRSKLAQLTVEHDGRSLGPFSLSAGVAMFPQHGLRSENLLAAADQALYAAKQGGRNRVVSA